jgi:hypothetical protein
MPRFEIKVRHQPEVEVPQFSLAQMEEIGLYGIEVSKERIASATDVFDRPAKPLKPKYAQRKIRRGLQPIRDIRFTGSTLAAMQLLYVRVETNPSLYKFARYFGDLQIECAESARRRTGSHGWLTMSRAHP